MFVLVFCAVDPGREIEDDEFFENVSYRKVTPLVYLQSQHMEARVRFSGYLAECVGFLQEESARSFVKF